MITEIKQLRTIRYGYSEYVYLSLLAVKQLYYAYIK